MGQFYSIIFTIFSFVLLGLFLGWRGEKEKRERLENILYKANKKIDLIKMLKPKYYVPTRHHSIAKVTDIHVSTYQECDDYERLESAVRSGSIRNSESNSTKTER